MEKNAVASWHKNKIKENSETDFFKAGNTKKNPCTLIQVPSQRDVVTHIYKKLYTNWAQIRKCMHKNSNKLFCCQEGIDAVIIAKRVIGRGGGVANLWRTSFYYRHLDAKVFS